jgi:4-amino-4-deoxy-L-arabinose transferase-like glycosyltransferase
MTDTDSKSKLESLDEMTRQIPKKGLPGYFYAFLLLHLVITLPLAYYLNIWADEGSTLYTTQNGFFQTFQNTLQDEKQAPLYFLLMSLWREINSSIFFARLFAIICSLFSIVIFFDLVRKLWDERTAIFAAFFFAIHPYLIFVSLEIRVYALMVLLTLILTKLFFTGYLERRKTNYDKDQFLSKKQILFIFTAIFSLYTNYYLGFCLVAFFAVLLGLRRWKETRRYFLQMAFVGLAIIPLLWAIKMQFAVNTGGHFQATNWLEGIKILWNHLLTFTLPTEIYSPEDQTFISFVRVWLVRIGGLAAVILLIIKQRLLNGRVLIFGTISLVIFAFLYFAYFMVSGVYIQIRHAAVWFSSICLLLVAVLSEILLRNKDSEKTYKTYWVGAVAVLLVAFYAYGIYALYPNLVKRGDWERVGSYIEQNERINQPIIIFPNYEALNLPYYYDGQNKILPNENFFKWNYEAEFGEPDVYQKQIDYVISVIPPDAEEIWLVTEEGCQTTKGCLPLEKFVKENYNIVETREFYKERVRLLRKK